MTDSWEKLSMLFHALRSRGDRWVTWNMNIHGGNLWCPASLWIIFHYTGLKSSQDWSSQYKFQHGLKTWNMKEGHQRGNNYLQDQVYTVHYFYFFSCKKLGPWQNLGKNIVANILRVRAFTGLFWKGGRCEVALGGSDTSFTQKPLPIQESSETSRSSVRNKTTRTLCIWE